MQLGSDENVRELLLAHASLYVLAEKWRVGSLKMLALFKLHRTLQMLHLDARKAQDIAELTRYISLDEMTPDLKTGKHCLAALLLVHLHTIAVGIGKMLLVWIVGDIRQVAIRLVW
jgi:hypothetical protein